MNARSGYLARLWRRLHPGRNPLARRYDRIEARILLTCLVGVLIALPFAAAAGSATYTDQVTTIEHEHATRHQTTATLLADAPMPVPATEGDLVASDNSTVPARWIGTDGNQHTGQLTAQAGTPAGTHVPLWLTETGDPTSAPASPGDATTTAVLAAAFAWLVVIMALTLVFWTSRWILDHRRVTQWDREWAHIGGDWTRF